MFRDEKAVKDQAQRLNKLQRFGYFSQLQKNKLLESDEEIEVGNRILHDKLLETKKSELKDREKRVVKRLQKEGVVHTSREENIARIAENFYWKRALEEQDENAIRVLFEIENEYCARFIEALRRLWKKPEAKEEKALDSIIRSFWGDDFPSASREQQFRLGLFILENVSVEDHMFKRGENCLRNGFASEGTLPKRENNFFLQLKSKGINVWDEKNVNPAQLKKEVVVEGLLYRLKKGPQPHTRQSLEFFVNTLILCYGKEVRTKEMFNALRDEYEKVRKGEDARNWSRFTQNDKLAALSCLREMSKFEEKVDTLMSPTANVVANIEKYKEQLSIPAAKPKTDQSFLGLTDKEKADFIAASNNGLLGKILGAFSDDVLPRVYVTVREEVQEKTRKGCFCF